MRGLATLVQAGFLLLPSAVMAEEKKGMPQLDFANPLTLSQVVWLAIIFFTLYLLLSRWALPQVGAVLEARASRIAGDLDAAKSAKAKADAAVAELKAATAKAHAEAQASVSTAVDAAKAEAAVQATAANAQLDAQLAAAEQRIAAARAAAMGALRDVALTTTVDVVARLTGAAVSQQNIEQAVDRALAARAA
ncbi:MAG: F0F1 ATP synthase subunit B' [Acetobacteraceae bacterium]|nr:F0F1 ATP synthase subunit B' [Acetobacteraceae bacterium]